MSDLLSSAMAYAKRGIPVFPCKLDKSPYTKQGHKDATTDVEQIKRWWERDFPGASIGMPTGEPSGMFALDIDAPDGYDSLSKLEGKNGELPDTLSQKTGGGGIHFLFKLPDFEVKNSASKIGPKIDIRGNGYIILSPSPHPSGNQYKWQGKREVLSAPEWLLKIMRNGSSHKRQRTNTYGQTALNNELANLGQSSAGQRNDVLNQAAYSLGQLVAGGELEYTAVSSSLLGVALSIGLNEREVVKTIESGMRAGALEPRSGNHDNDFGHLSAKDIDLSMKSVLEDTCGQLQTDVDTGGQFEDSLKTSRRHPEDTCRQYDDLTLTERITDWVTNSPGSFTNNDVDREFCISTRQEKKNRSLILSRLYMARKIKKDKRKKGLWHYVEQNIEFIDLNADEPESFPISLPFGIHDYVKIPPKAVILLAGSSNAGKTAFALNTIRMNLKQDYEQLYLMSEMGSGEYRTRVKMFGDDSDHWQKVKASSVSYGFDGAIEGYNQDGLTCIDYLEEVDGEYFKIPTDIRNIYDALGNGVALIAIQKRTDQDFARGGQGTVEKARLVMNLDYLATGDKCIICSLKLAKVKHFLERNLQGHEIHFKLEMGHKLTPLTDWMLSSRVNRKKYIQQYEAGNDNPSGDDLFFRTANGDNKRIISRDIQKWQEAMPNIDVYNELSKIAGNSVQKPFLSDKGYFFQLAGILKKKNDGTS